MAVVDVQRLVILGDVGVGKSSLVRRFLRGQFCETHEPTLEDLHRYMFKPSENKIFHTEILDTAGSHQFPAMRDLSIQSGKAFLVVYDVSNHHTIEGAKEILKTIDQIKGEGSVPIFMCGNKVDLPSRRRNEAVLQPLIQRCFKSMFVSAKNNYDVEHLFNSALRAMVASFDLLSVDSDNRLVSLGTRMKRRLSSLLGDKQVRRRFSEGDASDTEDNNTEPKKNLLVGKDNCQQIKRKLEELPMLYYRRQSIALTTRLTDCQGEPTVEDNSSTDDEVCVCDNTGGHTHKRRNSVRNALEIPFDLSLISFDRRRRSLGGKPMSRKEKKEMTKWLKKRNKKVTGEPFLDFFEVPKNSNRVKTCVEDDGDSSEVVTPFRCKSAFLKNPKRKESDLYGVTLEPESISGASHIVQSITRVQGVTQRAIANMGRSRSADSVDNGYFNKSISNFSIQTDDDSDASIHTSTWKSCISTRSTKSRASSLNSSSLSCSKSSNSHRRRFKSLSDSECVCS